MIDYDSEEWKRREKALEKVADFVVQKYLTGLYYCCLSKDYKNYKIKEATISLIPIDPKMPSYNFKYVADTEIREAVACFIYGNLLWKLSVIAGKKAKEYLESVWSPERVQYCYNHAWVTGEEVRYKEVLVHHASYIDGTTFLPLSRPPRRWEETHVIP
jgi:hypothetical protein